MNIIFRFLMSLSAFISFSLIAAPPKISSTTMAKTIEAQLNCIQNPNPGKVIRAMLANHLIKPTKFDADGSPVFAPTSATYVYGKKLKFITGWQMERDGSIKKPFWRGPGTAPPHFITIVLDANPNDVNYTVHRIDGADGSATYPFSSIDPTEEYDKKGTTITCYGEDDLARIGREGAT